MGFEVTLHAIVRDSDLLRAIQRDKINPDNLCHIASYFKNCPSLGALPGPDHLMQCSEDYLFVDCLESMLASSPGIDQRTCDLDRRFQRLQWVLARIEARSAPEDPLSEWAIYGEKPFTPAACSPQGFPIRWSEPETCVRISQWLSQIDDIAVRLVFDYPSMLAANLYKLFEHHTEHHIFETVTRDLQALQRFYREVAARGEAALILKD